MAIENVKQQRRDRADQETWYPREYRDYVPAEYPPERYPLDDLGLPIMDELPGSGSIS